MRIGIDVTFLFDQYSHRGIGTYARAVVTRLLQDDNHTWVLFGFKDLKSNLNELGLKRKKNIEFVSLGKPKNSGISNILAFKLKTKRKIIKSELDLYFAPHLERGLPIGSVKTALMVHDAIPYLTNSYSQKGKLHNYLKGIFYRKNLNVARKADLVLTNSEFTKNELINKAGFDKENIVVTYLAVDPGFKKENIQTDTRAVRRVLVHYKVTKPYILYYGGLEENKNVDQLLHTFSRISNKHPDLKLVIVGKEFKIGWDGKPKPQTPSAQKILELGQDLKLQHKIIYAGEVRQQHLPVLLDNSECFVSLSGYEGFGLAVLEAITSDTPVVAANKSSYPEILQDAAILVDPLDTVKTSEKILTLFQDHSHRDKLSSKRKLLAKKYNWDKTAQETLEAFVTAVNKNPKLKITYLIAKFLPEHGGAEVNCYEHARRMVSQGHDVTVITANNEKNSLPQIENIDGIEIKRLRRLTNQYYLGFYPGLFFTLLFKKMDILHVHGFGFLWHDWCVIWKKILSRKTIFINTPHGPFMARGNYGVFQLLLKIVYTTGQKLFLNRIYTKVIQVNPSQESWIKRYGISSEKIIYFPNGINSEELTPIKTQTNLAKLGLQRKYIISFTGRFEEYKGVQTVIKVMPKLIKLKRNVVFVVMGREGGYLENLKTLAKNLEVEKYIVFLENQDDTVRDEILANSKIFVMPSRWEAFGISILEAMAKKTAIITTRTEGGEFLVKEKENGYLYNFGDDKALYKNFEKLMKDSKLLASIQKNNYARAHEFVWDRIVQDYQQLLFDLNHG